MKKLAVAIVVLVALGGGAYVGGEYLLARSANGALEGIKASLPAGASLTHGALRTNLLRREVVLDGFAVTIPNTGMTQKLSATSLRLQGLPWVSKDSVELGEIVIDGLRIERGDIVTAERWEVEEPSAGIIGQMATGQSRPDLGFTSSRITNLTISRSGNTKLDASVGQIAAGTMEHNRVSHLEMNGIKASSQDMAGPLVKMNVASLTADNLDIGHIIAADGNIDLLAPLLSNYLSGLRIVNLSLGPEGGEPIVMDTLIATGDGLEDGTRTRLSLNIDRLVLPMASLAQSAAAYYRDLGYDKHILSLQVEGAYDPGQKTLSLNPLAITARDAGAVRLQVQLGGIGRLDDLKNGPEAAQMLMAAIRFDSLELKVQDSGLTKRIIDHGARAMEVEPAVYVEQLLNSIKPVAAGGGPGEKKLGEVYSAAGSFLINPGEFTFSARPEQPVALLELLFGARNLAGIAEKLNISASNRQLPQTPMPDGPTP